MPADLSPALVLMAGVKSGAEFCAMRALGGLRAEEATTPGLKVGWMDETEMISVDIRKE